MFPKPRSGIPLARPDDQVSRAILMAPILGVEGAECISLETQSHSWSIAPARPIR